MSENSEIIHERTLFYSRLREIREEVGMTQTEFAKSLGVALSTYSTYENGHQLPKSDLIIEVCRRYAVSADWLLGLDYEPKIETESDVLRTLLAIKHAGASVSDSYLSFEEPELLDRQSDLGLRKVRRGVLVVYESGFLNSTFDTLQILENNVKERLRLQSDVENFLEGQIEFLKDKPLSKDTDPSIAGAIAKKWEESLWND